MQPLNFLHFGAVPELIGTHRDMVDPFYQAEAAWAWNHLGPHMQRMPQAAGAPHLADDKDLKSVFC